MTPAAVISEDEPVLDSAAWLDAWTARTDYSRFALGAWIIERREPRGRTHTFGPKVALDRETFDSYYQSTVPYRRMTERRTYQLLSQAARRLHETVQLHSNIHKLGGQLHASLDGHHAALQVTGAVTDWLTYSYIYLDTEETFCKHLGEEEFARFKEATHEAYDAYPAYRFLYQLRHYAHHYGPPLASLDVSAHSGDRKVDIMLDKRQLFANPSFHWNRRSREVMDRQPERFPIMPLIEEAMEGYRLIEQRILKMYLFYVESWLDVSNEMLGKLGEHEGIPCLLAIPPDDTKPMLTLGSIGVWPIMTRANIARVEWALGQPDPIGAVWVERAPSRGSTPDDASTLKATQVMAAFFRGDRAAATRQINDILESDRGDAGGLIAGLVNQLAVSLHMVSSLLGSSPEALLNSDWAREDTGGIDDRDSG